MTHLESSLGPLFGKHWYNTLYYMMFYLTTLLPYLLTIPCGAVQTKEIRVDRVFQLLLIILVYKTSVTVTDVSGFSSPRIFLMCFMTLQVINASFHKLVVEPHETQIKPPKGATFSNLLYVT